MGLIDGLHNVPERFKRCCSSLAPPPTSNNNIDYDITDHYPVMAIINRNFMPTHLQPTLVRSYSNFISENFNEELLNKIENFMPQLDTITENNINDRFSQFYSL